MTTVTILLAILLLSASTTDCNSAGNTLNNNSNYSHVLGFGNKNKAAKHVLCLNNEGTDSFLSFIFSLNFASSPQCVEFPELITVAKNKLKQFVDFTVP